MRLAAVAKSPLNALFRAEVLENTRRLASLFIQSDAKPPRFVSADVKQLGKVAVLMGGRARTRGAGAPVGDATAQCEAGRSKGGLDS
jgi:hypothetical protein